MNGTFMNPRNFLAEFERLQRQLDRVFPASHSPASIRATVHPEFPALNVGSTPDTVEIVAFAPGIDPKSVQLTIDKGLLICVGERRTAVPEGDARVGVYAQERPTGPFRRVVSLPEDVDPGRVNATYRDGLLRVTVGKRESSKPRRIEVKS